MTLASLYPGLPTWCIPESPSAFFYAARAFLLWRLRTVGRQKSSISIFEGIKS
ncbi:hypothetical protein MIZ03_2167 [Rhodoferax lithotrophicus]|uniref:Uncharacterized protein n=2 Tax=Rhodoferax lithotrophicus TaxID=2798804 RepID=A0ABM7MLS2_9BURK|nr:hypothetical protein MIZ03_2167 [Rhodoferax sp. MIZ03]